MEEAGQAMSPSGPSAVGSVVVLRRNGKDGGRFLLYKPLASIGRHVTCDIRIQLQWVSRHHAQLRVTDDPDGPHRIVLLENLSKTNPTLINGEPCDGSQVLEHEDTFTVGDRSFRFEYAVPPTKFNRGMDDENDCDRTCFLDPQVVSSTLGSKVLKPKENGLQQPEVEASGAKKEAAKRRTSLDKENLGAVTGTPSRILSPERVSRLVDEIVTTVTESLPSPLRKIATPSKGSTPGGANKDADRRQSKPLPPAGAMPTPIRKAINARRQSYSLKAQQEGMSQPSPAAEAPAGGDVVGPSAMAMPLKRAIQARRRSSTVREPTPLKNEIPIYEEETEEEPMMSTKSLPTPIKKAISSRRKSHATPAASSSQQSVEEEVAPQAPAMPTPMKRAINSRRQSYATSMPQEEEEEEEEEEAPAAATVDEEGEGGMMATVKEDAPLEQAKMSLATPIKRAIQARRQSYVNVPQESIPEEEEEAVVKASMPTPLKRSIQSRRKGHLTAAVPEPDQREEEGDDEMVAQEEPVLPTPIKTAINAVRRQSQIGNGTPPPTPASQHESEGAISRRQSYAHMKERLSMATPLKQAVVGRQEHEEEEEGEEIPMGRSLPTPMRQAIQSRRQSYANSSTPVHQAEESDEKGAQEAEEEQRENQLGLPTPLKRQIDSRRTSYATRSSMSRPGSSMPPPVMPTPIKRAIQARRTSQAAPVADSADGTPMKKDVGSRRQSRATPSKPAPEEMVTSHSMPTPMKRAIQARRQSCASVPQQVEEEQVDEEIAMEPAAAHEEEEEAISHSMPTPMKRAIQARRQSYASVPQQVEDVEEEEVHEDSEELLEDEVQIAMVPAMPTPLKKDINSRRASYVTRSSVGRAGQAMAAPMMPTPMKRAIQARRMSQAGTPAPSNQMKMLVDEEEGQVDAMLAVPTPLKEDTRSRRASNVRRASMEVTEQPMALHPPSMPTPMKTAIQARRQSSTTVLEAEENLVKATPGKRLSAPRAPTPLKQATSSSRHSSLSSRMDSLEEDASAEDVNDTAVAMDLTDEGDSSIESESEEEDDDEIQVNPTMATPLRREIDSRRKSYVTTNGGAAMPPVEEHEVAQRVPLPTPMKRAIHARRTSHVDQVSQGVMSTPATRSRRQAQADCEATPVMPSSHVKAAALGSSRKGATPAASRRSSRIAEKVATPMQTVPVKSSLPTPMRAAINARRKSYGPLQEIPLEEVVVQAEESNEDEEEEVPEIRVRVPTPKKEGEVNNTRRSSSSQAAAPANASSLPTPIKRDIEARRRSYAALVALEAAAIRMQSPLKSEIHSRRKSLASDIMSPAGGPKAAEEDGDEEVEVQMSSASFTPAPARRHSNLLSEVGELEHIEENVEGGDLKLVERLSRLVVEQTGVSDVFGYGLTLDSYLEDADAFRGWVQPLLEKGKLPPPMKAAIKEVNEATPSRSKMEEALYGEKEVRRDLWAVSRYAEDIQLDGGVPFNKAYDMAMDYYLTDVQSFRDTIRKEMEAEAADEAEQINKENEVEKALPTKEEAPGGEMEMRRDMWAVQRLAHTIQAEANVPLARAQDMAMECYLSDVDGFRQDTRPAMESEAAAELQKVYGGEEAKPRFQRAMEAEAEAQGEVAQGCEEDDQEDKHASSFMDILSFLKKQRQSQDPEASLGSMLDSCEESGLSSSMMMIKPEAMMPSFTPGGTWDPFLSQDLKLVDQEARDLAVEGMEQEKAYGKVLESYLTDKEAFRKEAGQRQQRKSLSAEEAVEMVWQYAKELAEEGGIDETYAYGVALDTYLADREGFRAMMAKSWGSAAVPGLTESALEVEPPTHEEVVPESSLAEEEVVEADDDPDHSSSEAEHEDETAAVQVDMEEDVSNVPAPDAVVAKEEDVKVQQEQEEEEMEEVLALLCDGCDGDFPLVDLGLSEIPEGDWYCNDCQAALDKKLQEQEQKKGRRTARGAASKAAAPIKPTRRTRAAAPSPSPSPAKPAATRRTRAAAPSPASSPAKPAATRRTRAAAPSPTPSPAKPAPATRRGRATRSKDTTTSGTATSEEEVVAAPARATRRRAAPRQQHHEVEVAAAVAEGPARRTRSHR